MCLEHLPRKALIRLDVSARQRLATCGAYSAKAVEILVNTMRLDCGGLIPDHRQEHQQVGGGVFQAPPSKVTFIISARI